MNPATSGPLLLLNLDRHASNSGLSNQLVLSLSSVTETRLKQVIKNLGDADEAAGSGCNGGLPPAPGWPGCPPLGQVSALL